MFFCVNMFGFCYCFPVWSSLLTPCCEVTAATDIWHLSNMIIVHYKITLTPDWMFNYISSNMHVVRHVIIWIFCWRSDLCAVQYEDPTTCSVLLLHLVSAYFDQDVHSKCVVQNICINSLLGKATNDPKILPCKSLWTLLYSQSSIHGFEACSILFMASGDLFHIFHSFQGSIDGNKPSAVEPVVFKYPCSIQL
jgi:hypothetical protein